MCGEQENEGGHWIRNIVITNCVGRDRKNRALKNVEKCGGYPDENGKIGKLGKLGGGWLKSGGRKMQQSRKNGWVGVFLVNAVF